MDNLNKYFIEYSVRNRGKPISEYPVFETEKELYEDLIDILVHTKNTEINIYSNEQRIAVILARCYNGRNELLAKYLVGLLCWSGVGLIEDWQEDIYYYENLSPFNCEHKGETQGNLVLSIYLREKNKYVKNKVI